MPDDPRSPGARSPARDLAPKRATLSFGLPPVAPKMSESPRPAAIDVIEIPQDDAFERRRRDYRPLSVTGLADLMASQIGWMTEDQRDPFVAAIRAADLIRAHEMLATLAERYPKNITIKKTAAIFRAEVMRRIEEVFGGLHVLVRRTRSFPTIRTAERSRFAALIDGTTPIETILRRSKMDRLRGLEALYAWFKAGALEALEPGSDPASAAARIPVRSDVVPRAATSLAESWPPPIISSPPPTLRQPHKQVVPEAASPRAGLRSLGPSPTKPFGEDLHLDPHDQLELDLPASVRDEDLLPQRRDLERPGGRISQLPTPLPPRSDDEEELPPLPIVGRDLPTTGIELLAAASIPPDSDDPVVQRRTMTTDVDASKGRVGPSHLEFASLAGPEKDEPPGPAALPSAAPLAVGSSPGVHEVPAAKGSGPGQGAAPPVAATVMMEAPLEQRGGSAPVTMVAKPPPPLGDPVTQSPLVRFWWVAVLAAAAIAVVVVIAARSSDSSGPRSSTLSQPATGTSATPGAPSSVARGDAQTAGTAQRVSGSAASDSSEPAAPGMIRVTLELDPHYARAFLDNKELPKGKEHLIPKDGKQHEVRVEAVGYKKRKLKFVADADTRLVVALELNPSSNAPAPAAPTSNPIYD